MDWLMRPVDRGYCTMRDLKDGSLDLEDVAIMNETIDVREENARRLDAARRQQRG